MLGHTMKEVLMPPRNPRNNVALVSMSPPVSERDVLPLKLTIELSKVIIILPSNVQCSTELCWDKQVPIPPRESTQYMSAPCV